MSELWINNIKCVGCGLCVESCPQDALRLEDKKAIVNSDACALCGLCIENCRFGALSLQRDDYGKVDSSLYRDVWVFCEASEDKLLPVGYELVGKARELADIRKNRVVALVFGTRTAKEADALIKFGADEVLVCEDPLFDEPLEMPFVDLIAELIESCHPETFLFGATPFGRSVAPRVAARVQTGLTADCTILDIELEKGILLQTRPAFGGNLLATIHTENFRPQMATVRPGIIPLPTPNLVRKGIISHVAPPVGDYSNVLLLHTSRNPRETSITDADIIIAAGKGIGSMKNMVLVEELAELLDGAVGCSRAVVDIGWAEYRHQIGQTGLSVSPKLLITCGVSGSIQFMAGIRSAKTIVAINIDPEAPIFGVAHHKVVGDCLEILNEMIRQVRQRFKELIDNTR
jgi:electron transfer flavoprotein alpha subunit